MTRNSKSHVWGGRGSANGNSTLTEDDARAIKRALRDGVKVAEIAELYGVGKGAIYAIKRGQTWRHVRAEAE